jgi:hypothetical protein
MKQRSQTQQQRRFRNHLKVEIQNLKSEILNPKF